MAVTLNASTTTGLVQSADTSGIIELQSNGTTALTVNTNEGIQILNCLGVGNATPSTSGAGITFPASQSASTDANTLDDYEEGTWTPTLFQGSTQITSPTLASGRYVKIGKMLWIGGYFYKASGAPSASGDIEIRNLPFSLDPDQAGVVAASTGYNAVNGSASTQAGRFQANSSTALSLYGQYSATSWTTSYIEFSFSGCLLTLA
jgi:hypothetical protein